MLVDCVLLMKCSLDLDEWDLNSGPTSCKVRTCFSESANKNGAHTDAVLWREVTQSYSAQC